VLADTVLDALADRLVEAEAEEDDEGE